MFTEPWLGDTKGAKVSGVGVGVGGTGVAVGPPGVGVGVRVGVTVGVGVGPAARVTTRVYTIVMVTPIGVTCVTVTVNTLAPTFRVHTLPAQPPYDTVALTSLFVAVTMTDATALDTLAE